MMPLPQSTLFEHCKRWWRADVNSRKQRRFNCNLILFISTTICYNWPSVSVCVLVSHDSFLNIILPPEMRMRARMACSRDCCFDEINVSDNWWWELITGTIICVWSVYICSLCPFRSSPALWAPWWAAPSPAIQPGISHIYHIHHDHNVTVGTHRSEREMARTILSLFKLSRK